MADLISDIKIARSIPSQLAASTKTGTTIDRFGFGSLSVLFEYGAYTDGTFTPKLTESDDDSSFTDVAAADLIASPISAQALAAVTAASKIQSVGYRGTKRYIRPVVTVTGSPSTGAQIAALGILGHSINKPAA